MGSLTGPKARREPAGEAKPDVCVISESEAGAYCTVGLVFWVTESRMQNFRTLGNPLLAEMNRNTINSDHYVLPATPKGSACTFLG